MKHGSGADLKEMSRISVGNRSGDSPEGISLAFLAVGVGGAVMQYR